MQRRIARALGALELRDRRPSLDETLVAAEIERRG
jgi:hypothetical protein